MRRRGWIDNEAFQIARRGIFAVDVDVVIMPRVVEFFAAAAQLRVHVEHEVVIVGRVVRPIQARKEIWSEVVLQSCRGG